MNDEGLRGGSGNRSLPGVFATTRWSVVLAAGAAEDSAEGWRALEELCRFYWFPVYALARRQGLDPESARDATQEFFARMLSRDGFSRVRRERGRFRAFLAQSVRNFLTDEWNRGRAQKRGGAPALAGDVRAAQIDFCGVARRRALRDQALPMPTRQINPAPSKVSVEPESGTGCDWPYQIFE
jgi:DNA-directed RNA polymerase specialized sigma24 family protein